jgi:hypothetical protein
VEELLLTFGAFGDRQKNAGNKRLAVMRLLEDGNPLAKTGSVMCCSSSALRAFSSRQQQ